MLPMMWTWAWAWCELWKITIRFFFRNCFSFSCWVLFWSHYIVRSHLVFWFDLIPHCNRNPLAVLNRFRKNYSIQIAYSIPDSLSLLSDGCYLSLYWMLNVITGLYRIWKLQKWHSFTFQNVPVDLENFFFFKLYIHW